MKKSLLSLFLICFCTLQNSYSQVNNLSDFLYLTELSEYGLTVELQDNWKSHQPTESIDKGRATSIFTWTYDNNEIKQVVKRVINMDIKTAYKIRSTTFISDDLIFLERIEKSLSAKEFFLVTNEDRKILYEDGNRILKIERDFHERATGLYMITIINKEDFFMYADEKIIKKKYVSDSKNNDIRLNQKWKIKGVEKNDLGIFNLKVYNDWKCEIELNIRGKQYKSIECNSEKETALLISKNDTLKIEYSTPELVDANINILGNDLGFDYISFDELNNVVIIEESDTLLLKHNSVNNYGVKGRLDNEIPNRKIIYKPKQGYPNCKEKGKVNLLLRVKSNGEVDSVSPTRGITNPNPCLIQHSIRLAKKYKWDEIEKNEIQIFELNFEYK